MLAIIFDLALSSGPSCFSEMRDSLREGEAQGCSVIIDKKLVRGTSMEPAIKRGRLLTILQGYYTCNPVRRKDVVAFRYAGNIDPLIKRVMAVPGDRWELRKQRRSSDRWNIFVNGQILKNSRRIPYSLDHKRSRLLEMYAQSHHGQIPKHSYLLLGDDPKGSVDSTRLGLIFHSDIIGKVRLH